MSKVVQVAEATKRSWYKTSGYDEELHQYVNPSFDDLESAPKKGKGRRIINLDDPAIASTPSQSITPYQPPDSLVIHLSKISMPELEPKATGKNPRLVVREPSPTRKPDKEKHEHHGHYKGHKHHLSELNVGSLKISGHDTKGRSHHHSHISQGLISFLLGSIGRKILISCLPIRRYFITLAYSRREFLYQQAFTGRFRTFIITSS